MYHKYIINISIAKYNMDDYEISKRKIAGLFEE